ncbi:putative beta-glucosidase F [Yarrowia sp. C11]|nr:putative beta-glucosidase F [Yarrowia sp. E02]KAG5372751.1 putative beta-glucosidase F [Yarrowia sp. C11]
MFALVLLLTTLFTAALADPFSDKDAYKHSPPFYPAPEIGRVPTDLRWRAALKVAQDMVANMTLIEKVNITTGTGWEMGPCVGNTGTVERLGIKSLCLQDGPLGIRFADLITTFPAGITIASTFSRDLVRERGAAMGRENRRKGVDITLSPVVGPLGRHANGGRIWEGFSADPYLAGKLAAEAVTGIQSQNSTFDSLESGRVGFKDLKQPLSSNIDDRTLNEAYLWPFADAVRANVGSVMCSYQQINGSQGCQNAHILNGKLKEEMGFQGFVMSDWLAQRSGVASVLAGLDMSMPGDGLVWADGVPLMGYELTKSVLNGTIDENRVDDMVTRILTPIIYLSITPGSPNFSSWTNDTTSYKYYGAKAGGNVTVNKHIDVRDEYTTKAALDGANAALVLLKNEKNALPLNPSNIGNLNIFGIGSTTDPLGAVCGENMQCSDGALIEGWGSGSVYPTDYQSPYDAIKERASKDNITVGGTTQSWGNLSNVEILSYAADASVVFVLSDSGESTGIVDGNIGDRNNLTLWHNGDEVVKAVASTNPNTIVVVTTVGPVNLEKWIDNPNVTAVLLTGPAGDFGGRAAASILFGDISPSGKLPFTIAKNDTDYIPLTTKVPEDGLPQDYFTEGTLLDYKRFDENQVTPRFEFGYGLSYSNITVENLVARFAFPSVPEFLPTPFAPLDPNKPKNAFTPNADEAVFPSDIDPLHKYVYPYLKDSSEINSNDTHYPYPHGYSNEQSNSTNINGGAVGGNPALWLSAVFVVHSVSNYGPYDTGVVTQMYIAFPQDDEDLKTAPRQLRGFERSELKVGERRGILYNVQWRDLAVWDVKLQSWRVQRGEYKVYVGHSSRDFVLTTNFTLT